MITFHCNIHHFVTQDSKATKHWKNEPKKNLEGSVDIAYCDHFGSDNNINQMIRIKDIFYLHLVFC